MFSSNLTFGATYHSISLHPVCSGRETQRSTTSLGAWSGKVLLKLAEHAWGSVCALWACAELKCDVRGTWDMCGARVGGPMPRRYAACVASHTRHVEASFLWDGSIA